jgi:F5/8 type C domain
MACPRCGAAGGEDANFCVRCGLRLRDDGGLGAGDDAPVERETSVALLAVTALAALLIGGVLATLLGARGIGFLASPQASEPAGAGPVRLDVSAVTVSSALPPAGAVDYGSENLVDGEPTTAWNEGAAGDGTGEWVEVALTGPADISRVLLWNGYQKGAAFDTNNRVAELRLELSGMPFVAPLLDVEGPQAIKLPQPVRADRVRLVIERVYPGNRYNDAAISDLEIYGEPVLSAPVS